MLLEYVTDLPRLEEVGVVENLQSQSSNLGKGKKKGGKNKLIYKTVKPRNNPSNPSDRVLLGAAPQLKTEGLGIGLVSEHVFQALQLAVQHGNTHTWLLGLLGLTYSYIYTHISLVLYGCLYVLLCVCVCVMFCLGFEKDIKAQDQW